MTVHPTPTRPVPAQRGQSARVQDSPVGLMMQALQATLSVAQLDLLLDRIEAKT